MTAPPAAGAAGDHDGAAPGPEADLPAVREATARLLALVDGLLVGEGDAALRAPSLLPGWSRAHVVAHVAGNARGHGRMVDGQPQYPGGRDARAAEIDALAADPPAAVAAAHDSAAELERAWARADWSAPARVLDGTPRTVGDLVWARWREVEVHAVDLALPDYRPADWPQPFLGRLLDELRARPDLPPLDGVEGSDADLAAWLAGRSRGEGLRGDLPELPPWR